MLRTLLHLFLHGDQVAILCTSISLSFLTSSRDHINRFLLIKEHKNSYLVRRKTNCEKIKHCDINLYNNSETWKTLIIII